MVNINNYTQNNLDNSLPKIFGSSSAMSLEDFYCEKTWEIVIQDACGNELLNVTNCGDHDSYNFQLFNCSKEIPSPPVTTQPPTPTTTTTRPPRSNEPVTKHTAFFLDYKRYFGPLEYIYKTTAEALIHEVKFPSHEAYPRLPSNYIYNDSNVHVAERSGTACFAYDSPIWNGTDYVKKPYIMFSIGGPGFRLRGQEPNFNENFNAPQYNLFRDPLITPVWDNKIKFKAYYEGAQFGQYFAGESSYLMEQLNNNNETVPLPFLETIINLDPYSNSHIETIRLEAHTELGVDIIYLDYFEHPRIGTTDYTGLLVPQPERRPDLGWGPSF